MGIRRTNGIERCCSKNPRWCTEQRVRRWQGPRTSSTSGTSESDRRRRGTPTEQRVMVPPEIPHDARTCIGDPDFEESHSDGSREKREMQDECRRWNTQTLGSRRHPNYCNAIFRPTYGVGGRSRRRSSHMDEWKQLCVEMNAASETDTQDGSIEKVAEAQECDGLSEQDLTILREKWSYNGDGEEET